jgi:CPA1 family monovalent cation:H+ antiporter
VLSVPLLLGAGEAFPERDLLIFIAAGVILLSLIAACIALPLLLLGIEKSPDDKRRNEVREAWRKTAEAAIHALEVEEPTEATSTPDAAQAALATEVKARLMSEYRQQLEVFNDSAEAQALAFEMDLLERRLRLKAYRAQRLELYRLSRHHQIGDDVLREVLGELDLAEANLGLGK